MRWEQISDETLNYFNHFGLVGLKGTKKELYEKKKLVLPHRFRFDRYSRIPDLSILDNLEIFDCNYSCISTIESLPPNLKNLSCQSNNLQSLPPLSKSLGFLDCSGNKIKRLQINNVLEIRAKGNVFECYSHEKELMILYKYHQLQFKIIESSLLESI